MVTQLALLDAVQLQCKPAVTFTLPLEALELKEALVEESVYVQGLFSVTLFVAEVAVLPAAS
jgi:hypothetical protein